MKEHLGFYYNLSSDGKNYAIYDRTVMLGSMHLIACGASAKQNEWIEPDVLEMIEKYYNQAKERNCEDIFIGV